MGKIRTFLVDDHAILREGIRALLAREPDIEFAGEAASGEEALEKIGEIAPDIILMDVTLPGMNGLEAAAAVKKKNPEIKVIILASQETAQDLSGMLDAGAAGYVVKTTGGEELVSAIRATYRGHFYINPSMATMLMEDYRRRAGREKPKTREERLTEREYQVLKFIAENKKNKEIAEILKISVRTVQAHRTSVMDKLGAHDRTQLVKYAISKGIVEA